MNANSWSKTLLGVLAIAVSSAALATSPANSLAGSAVTLAAAGTTPVIASDAVGGYAVVYENGGNIDVSAFDPSGQLIGTQTVNTTAGASTFPAITMTPTGNFVVAFQQASAIYFRRFQIDNSTNAGVLSALDTSQVLVSSAGITTAPAYATYSPAIASDQNGNFVVVWSAALSTKVAYPVVYAQLFNSSGTANSSIFKVNTTIGQKVNPSVAMSPSGDFVVAWEGSDSNGFGVYARRYSSAGTALDAADVQINTNISNLDGFPSTAKFPNGDYVIAYQEPNKTGTGIFKRKFQSSGTAYDAADVQVIGPAGSVLITPKVAADALGGYVIVYGSSLKHSAETVASRFNPSNAVVGAAVVVDSTSNTASQTPTVAVNAQGDARVAFQNNITGGVQGQTIAGIDSVDLALTVIANPVSPEAVNGSFGYEMDVTNNATAQTPTGIAAIDSAIGTAYGITLTGTLPSNVTIDSFSHPNVAWNCNATGQTFTCTFLGTRTLGPGAITSVRANVSSNTAGTNVAFTPAVTDTPFDGTSANNSATATVSFQSLPGSLEFIAANFGVDASGGTGTATIKVKRVGGVSGTVTVNYSETDGTALAGTDYTASTGTLTWGPGDKADKSFTVAVQKDGSSGQKTLSLVLSGQTGGATVGSNATLHIEE